VKAGQQSARMQRRQWAVCSTQSPVHGRQ